MISVGFRVVPAPVPAGTNPDPNPRPSGLVSVDLRIFRARCHLDPRGCIVLFPLSVRFQIRLHSQILYNSIYKTRPTLHIFRVILYFFVNLYIVVLATYVGINLYKYNIICQLLYHKLLYDYITIYNLISTCIVGYLQEINISTYVKNYVASCVCTI